MARIAIGIGAIIAAVAGLGWGSSIPVSLGLLGLGGVLIANGGYEVYAKPNVCLDRTLKRWLERHDWTVTPADVPRDKFHFAVWAEDLSHRKVLISREKQVKSILAFSAPIELDSATVTAIGQNLSGPQQQRLNKELHVALASMHLGYSAGDLRNMAVQHALPIDDQLAEHAVDFKAKEVADGVIVARELCRKAII